MDVLETMKTLKVLKSLKPEELRNLSNNCIVSDYNKGQYVYKSGMRVKYVFVILNGNVKIGADSNAKQSIVKEVLTSQDIFGENVFVGSQIRGEYVEATAATTILKIPVNEFKVLVMENAPFYQTIMSIIVMRLHVLEQRMQNFVFLKARKRIMSFLKMMGEQRGKIIGFDEVLLRLNMSHKEIALLTDTSRQTVARILGELKRESIIHFTTRKPGRILIRNMNALA